MSRAVLITGGDLGDARANCLLAAQMVEQRIGHIVDRSSIVESEAWGFESQHRFANQVLVVECELSPMELLAATQQIEREFGRTKGAEPEVDAEGHRVYRSRMMDVDILFYDNMTFNAERLTIPHPMLHQRAFVLDPLCEVMPEFVHPVLGLTVRQLREQLKTKE